MLKRMFTRGIANAPGARAVAYGHHVADHQRSIRVGQSHPREDG
jgi:hypothetical protein